MLYTFLQPVSLFKIFCITLFSLCLVSCQPRNLATSSPNKKTQNAQNPTFGKSFKTKKVSTYTQFSDMPFPSGAIIDVERTTVVGSRPWYGQLTFSVSSNVSSVFEFFDTKMETYRWQKITSVRAETSILTFIRQNRVLSISIKEKTLKGTKVTIVSSPFNQTGNSSTKNKPQGDLMPVPVQKIN